jgi:hypothetical protein
MISSKIEKPPENETILTRNAGVLIFAAYHLGKWYEVPRGGQIPEPEEWLKIPLNELDGKKFLEQIQLRLDDEPEVK